MDASAPDAVGTLIEQTRVRRLALHRLVVQVQRDHAIWLHRLEELSSRVRLTREQRAEFRRRMSRLSGPV